MKKIFSITLSLAILVGVVTAIIVNATPKNLIKIDSKTVTAGSEFSVDLSVNAETGIVGLEMLLDYPSAFELLKVELKDEFFPTKSSVSQAELRNNPFYFAWENSLKFVDGEYVQNTPITGSGKLATLTFKASETALNQNYEFNIFFEKGGAFDFDLNDVDFETANGIITVTDGVEPPTNITTTTSTANPTTSTTITTTSTATSTSSTTTATTNSTTNSSQTNSTTTGSYGEKKSVVLYDMSDSSRPISNGTTTLGTGSFVELDGDWVLRLARKQDQAIYFNLPTNVYSKYGKPVKLSFEVKTDANAYRIFESNFIFNSKPSSLDGITVSGVYEFNSTWKTVSADLSAGNGLNAVNNNDNFINIRNPYTVAAQSTYVYIDNVILEYLEPIYNYEISVDGAKTIVKAGEEFEFPRSNKDGFVAYTDGTKYFDEGDKIVVNKLQSFTSITVDIQMEKGAAMRYSLNGGLRFYTRINTQDINALNLARAELSFGTLIAPADLIGDKDFVHSNDYLDVKYTVGNIENLSEFTGSVVDINAGNEVRNFIGRGYVKIKLGEIEKTIYANYFNSDIINNTRNIAWIAKQIKLNQEYLELPDENKSICDYYASF